MFDQKTPSCYICYEELDPNGLLFRSCGSKGLPDHGVHLSCLQTEERPTSKNALFCKDRKCLEARNIRDPKIKQMFPEVDPADNRKASCAGVPFRVPPKFKGSKDAFFDWRCSRNGFPLYNEPIGSKKTGILHGSCCNSIEWTAGYQCEHGETLAPPKKQTKAFKQWTEKIDKGSEMWGTFEISQLADVLIKVFKLRPHVQNRTKNLVVCAAKVRKARLLKRWKTIIMNHFNDELLPVAQTYTLVNVEIGTAGLMGKLPEAAKAQHNLLCKYLEGKRGAFTGPSISMQALENDVREAVLGIAGVIAESKRIYERTMRGDEKKVQFLIGAVRLIKTPANFEILPHIDREPFQNPTALLLEGTAKLIVEVGSSPPVEHNMFFGEARSNPPNHNNDYILLKYVDLENKRHRVPGSNYTCVWFSVNFFQISPD